MSSQRSPLSFHMPGLWDFASKIPVVGNAVNVINGVNGLQNGYNHPSMEGQGVLPRAFMALNQGIADFANPIPGMDIDMVTSIQNADFGAMLKNEMETGFGNH